MPYLFAAFSVVWLAVFGYAAWIAGRQRALAREVEALRRMVEDSEND